MSGLRERNKERRRQAILEAALDLLRSNDLQAVTIEQVAARAEVSPPTIYNLVGTREQLLVALVDRIIEDLLDSLSAPIDAEGGDPIAIALRAVERSAAAFVADSAAYRQIVRALGDLAVSGSRMAIDPAQIHVRAMAAAQQRGILRPDLDARALGRQSYLTYVAALFTWAAGDLDDRAFALAARHGLVTVVAAASTDEHRGRYLAELVRLSQRFAKVDWRRR